MVSFFQKYRVFFIVVAWGLSLLGLSMWEGRHEEALVIFTTPGIMLGVFMYLINPKRKHSPKMGSAAAADEILKWSQLKDSGAITEPEYEIIKMEIISRYKDEMSKSNSIE